MRAIRARADAHDQARQQTRQRRESLLIPLAIALMTRVIVLVAADLILRFGLEQRQNALPYMGPVASWQGKDALWYIAIAQSGYNYSPVAQSRANFFPLYPLLIHIFAPFFALFPTSNPYALAGMAISWVTFAAACVGLYRLTLDHFGRTVAIGATLLVAVFPYGLYFGADYTESLYLALAVWAFVAIERRQWWIAAALAGIACASRPPGLLVGACVALAYALDWYRTRHPLRPDLLALALTPVGTLAYMLYCYVRWGDPLAYVKTSRAGWNGGHLQIGGLHYAAGVLLHTVKWLTTGDRPNHLLTWCGIILTLGFLALTPLVLRRLGPVYALFSVASVLAPLLDFPTASSLGRYLSVVFPVFMVLAYLLRKRPYVLGVLCAVAAPLLMLFAAYFMAGFGLA